MTAMALESDKASTPKDVEVLRGPHGWVNWRAELRGNPRRTSKHPDNILIRPIWQEFALYSDTELTGPWLNLGPYEFIEIDHITRPRIGEAQKVIVLRVWDHLADFLPVAVADPETDVEDFTGGDIGDELTALLGLALGRRFRSGGMVRQGLPESAHTLGLLDEHNHRAPALQPPHRGPMIHTITEATSLQEASTLMGTYPNLEARDAVALVRSARQYVDGLWLADADPRLAWIKLVGALEAAASRFDDWQGSDVEQLERHRPTLFKTLKGTPDLLQAVAKETSRLFRVEAKLRAFVKKFDPGPPATRPEGEAFRFEWENLDNALAVIYNHRSRDLHDGIAFPPPLCEPPIMANDEGVPSERFPVVAVSTLGAEWTSDELPFYLHVFAHVVGGALRNWWHSFKE